MMLKRKPQLAPEVSPAQVNEPTGFFQRLRARVNKGQSWLTRDLRDLFADPEAREELFETLETRLLLSDVGINLCERLLNETKQRLARKQQAQFDDVVVALREQMLALVRPLAAPLNTSAHKPFVLLVVGVNGSGKTTTIGKVAAQFKSDNKKVMLAAGDTFRAAAIEQLQVWGERN
ncbi:MAG: signal recognition particle-docking protein FtsY, partial [Gammaproteobacteria bacterium]|nr:signal recognition particle-docking protein FtsY [Gammaproteobacteria bacterium]